MIVLRTNFLILSLILPLFFFAQNNTIRGVVYYQNTNFNKAVGVLIKPHPLSSDHANQIYSDDKGAYVLKYNNRKEGDAISVFVGDKTESGEAIELVNQKELEIWSIPSNAMVRSFDIVVCKKGARDKAARQYYQLLKNDSDKKLAQKQKELDALLLKFGQQNAVIRQQEEEINVLLMQSDSAKMYKEALDIASINKDGASPRILKYLSLLDAGISVDEARKELSVQKSFAEGKMSLTQLQAGIQEIETSINLMVKSQERERAINQSDTLLLLIDQPLIDKSILIQRLINVSRICIGTQSWEKQLRKRGEEYARRAYRLQKDYLSSNNTLKPTVCITLGELQLQSGKFTDAEKMFIEAIEATRLLSKQDSLTWTYQVGIAEIYLSTISFSKNEWAKARIGYLKAINLLRLAPQPFSDEVFQHISFALEKMAVCLQKQLMFYSADSSFSAAINILDEPFKENPYKWVNYIAEKWKRYSTLLENIHRVDDADKAYMRAIELYEVLPPEQWINSVRTIRDILLDRAGYHASKKEFQKTEMLYQRLIKIYEKATIINPLFMTSASYGYRFLGNLYRDHRLFDKAEYQYTLAAKEYSKKKTWWDYYSISIAYLEYGKMHEMQKHPEDALKLYGKAFQYDLLKQDTNNFVTLFSSEVREKLVGLYKKMNLNDSAEKVFSELDRRYKIYYRIDPLQHFYSWFENKKKWAEYYHQSGQHQKANIMYDQLVKISRRQDSLDKTKNYEIWALLYNGEHFEADRNYQPSTERYKSIEEFVVQLKDVTGNNELFNYQLGVVTMPYASLYWKRFIGSGDKRYFELAKQCLQKADSLFLIGKTVARESIDITEKRRELKKYFDLAEGKNFSVLRSIIAYDSVQKIIKETDDVKAHITLYRESIELLQNIVIHIPGYDSAQMEMSRLYGNLAWAYLFDRSFRDAEQAALKGLEINPEKVWIKVNLAHALLYQNRLEEAKRIYLQHQDDYYNNDLIKDILVRDLQQLEEKGITSQNTFTVIQMLKGDFAESTVLFYRKLMNGKSRPVWIYRQIGDIYFKNEMYDSAYVYYAEALNIQQVKDDSLSDPELGMVLFGIGNYHQVNGEYIVAADYYTRASKILTSLLNRQHPALVDLRANIMQNGILSGKKYESLQEYEKKEVYSGEELVTMLINRIGKTTSLPFTKQRDLIARSKMAYVDLALNNYSELIPRLSGDITSWFSISDTLRTGLGQTAHLLSLAYYGIAAYQDALFYEKMSVNAKERFSTNAAEWLTSYTNMASIYHGLGNVAEKNICDKKVRQLEQQMKNTKPGKLDFLNYRLELEILKRRAL